MREVSRGIDWLAPNAKWNESAGHESLVGLVLLYILNRGMRSLEFAMSYFGTRLNGLIYDLARPPPGS